MDKKTQTAGETAARAKSQWLQDLNETLNAFQETMEAEKNPDKAIIIMAADAATGEGITIVGGGSEPLAALIADFLTNKGTAKHVAHAAQLMALRELKKQNGGAVVIHINADQEDEADEDQKPQANGETEQPAMD